MTTSQMPSAKTAVDTPLSADAALGMIDALRSDPKQGFAILTADRALCRHPKLAAVLTECAIVVGRLEVAAHALPRAKDPTGILRAQLCMAQNDPAAALSALKSLPRDARRRVRYWGLRIRCNALLGRYEDAVTAAESWAIDAPNTPAPFRILARTLAETGDRRARQWLDHALDVSGGNRAILRDRADLATQKAPVHLRAI